MDIMEALKNASRHNNNGEDEIPKRLPEAVIDDLKVKYGLLNVRHEFKPGDIVRAKDGLGSNYQFAGEPHIVVIFGENEVCSLLGNRDSVSDLDGDAMGTNDLRENIAEILEEWGEDKEDRGVASAHGRYVDISEPREIADRILALLPKMPELRWKDGRFLIGEMFAGCEVDCHGYILPPDGWEDRIVDGVHIKHDARPEQETRRLAEEAVREALGWETAK